MSTNARPTPSAISVRPSWLWLAASPLFVVVGLLAGYAVEGLLAPDTDSGNRSLVADVVGGLVILAIWLVPILLARRSAEAAAEAGSPAALAPIRIANVLAVGMVLVVVGAMVWNAVQGLYS